MTAVFQPIIHLSENKILQYEALVRFSNHDGLLISTQQMIEEIEREGVINEVTDFMFETVCQLIKLKNGMSFSINLSHVLLNDIKYLNKLYRKCLRNNISPKNIEIEVSEKVTKHQLIDGLIFLKKAKEYGFMVSLDDFGAGNLQIDNLEIFDFDTIKIDRSMVDGIGTEVEKFKKLEILLKKLNRLGVNIICEGVEKNSDLEKLNKYDHIGVQGFIHYRPLTLSQLRLLEGF